MEAESDWELIVRCRGGSVSAFEPLVRRHEAMAMLVASAMLGDPDEAADAVQDAFVKAYRSLRQLKEGSAFGPWFRTIVRNRCRDMMRSVPRRDRVSWDSLAGAPAISVESDGTLMIEREQLAVAVEGALAKLSPEHRDILVLKEIEGLSYAEIAGEVGVPEGTVASRLFHARRALRAVVTAEGIARPGGWS